MGNIQRAIAALFRQFRRRVETGIEVQAIAGNQAIEVNHQQRITFLFRAHALQIVLCTQRTDLFGAGGDKAQAVSRGDILQAFRQLQHHTNARGIVIDAL
ncbi:hypothetical protein D3C79_913680 [compost metagenome]